MLSKLALVLDTFLGMELDPLYVDLAIRRWQHIGGCAIHAETGVEFATGESAVIDRVRLASCIAQLAIERILCFINTQILVATVGPGSPFVGSRWSKRLTRIAIESRAILKLPGRFWRGRLADVILNEPYPRLPALTIDLLTVRFNRSCQRSTTDQIG